MCFYGLDCLSPGFSDERIVMSRGKSKQREKFTVEVERLDGEGRGVAHHEGKVVFIEGALPGELVTYERIRNKQNFEVGTAVAVERPCALRVEPKCPNFGIGPGNCGGCAMQHLEPRAQVAFKQQVLLDALWHIGKVRPEGLLPPIHGPYWHYRHRARLTVRNVAKKGGVLVGFHERSSSYVADMTECHILPQKISDLLVPMRELVAGLSICERMPQIEVAVGGDGHTALVFWILEPLSEADRERLLAFGRAHDCAIWLQPKGPDSVFPMVAGDEQKLGLDLKEFGVRIVFKPTDFTQVNHQLNETMVSRAVRLLGVQSDESVADFFCGLGNFTLPLATRARQVIGIEGSEGLVERARLGAKDNNLTEKTEFVARNLFTWQMQDWDALWEKMGGIDRVLIDPPREGAQALAQTLAKTDRRPKRIVYVSCNPATLARDCAILLHEGGWRVRRAGVMNMFPHTGHVESMAVLEPGPRPQKSEPAVPGGEEQSLEVPIPQTLVQTED